MNWMKWIITNVQNGSAKKATVLKTLARDGGRERERWRAREGEMQYFSEGQKSSIINFLIMFPWLHIWTQLQDINQKSAWLCERTFVCAGVLFAVIYVPSCLCVLQCFLYCTGAAQGSVRLLDQWQTGVLFITWWRMTDESLYESMYVHQAAELEVENPLFKTTVKGLICSINYH